MPGTCGPSHYSTDPQFNCPKTPMCYGGSGTCPDGIGYFRYVRQVAGEYADCTYSTSGGTCVIPAAPVCTSTGYPNRDALGVCNGGVICESKVTVPGCKPLAVQP